MHKYLIIGNGRVGRHFAHYFDLLKLDYSIWARKNNNIDQLKELTQGCQTVIIALSDAAIDGFIEENEFLKYKTLVHLSGSFISKYAKGIHPLTTFSDDLWDAEIYKSIHFVIEEDIDFVQTMPNIPNKYYIIKKWQKPYYHSLCVMAGNFSCMLWQNLFNSFENELNIPIEAALPYLKAQTYNLISNRANALTGPFVRNDLETIESNIKSLQNNPYQKIYIDFWEIYKNFQQAK